VIDFVKCFYKEVAVEVLGGGYAVTLDGRTIKTPQRAELTILTKAIAEAVAAEWREQREKVDPDSMPMMRYAATTMDKVAPARAEIIAIVAAFAGHDLLCYRAEDEVLATLQNELWQPLLDWVAGSLDAPLGVTVGIVSIDQPAESLASLKAKVATFNDGEVAALHVMASLSGSLVIALALALGEIDVDRAWRAATVDESHQAEKWGLDEEAGRRLSSLQAELQSAQRYYALCQN
jgi:chaperone required for assembly of F1-ATPase